MDFLGVLCPVKLIAAPLKANMLIAISTSQYPRQQRRDLINGVQSELLTLTLHI